MPQSPHENNPPKVFVSHASEDKDRFVVEFATALRENGVATWLDTWEMLPGDSLVDKIFHEGIKNSEVVIIILSQFSVQKPWVREEINASFIQRIHGRVRIIPVVIDECEIPEALRSTLYEKISNLTDYKDSLRRILLAIFEVSDRPALGSPPSFARLAIDKIPGLNATDTLLFRYACELTLEDGNPWVRSNAFEEKIKELDLTDSDALETVQILENRWLIKVSWSHGGSSPFLITTRGFEVYGKYYVENFELLLTNTLVAILNNNLTTKEEVAIYLNRAPMFAEYVLDILKDRKLIRTVSTLGGGYGNVVITEVTAEGRRAAAQTR